jgi:predicted aspartyl protease
MRIDGEWFLFSDGIERPVIRGEILTGDGSWAQTLFLVDTGADRTVFSAGVLSSLGSQPISAQGLLGGLGGLTNSIIVETQIRLTREDNRKVLFRGQYAAVTELESLDISVLGRDITGL